MYKKKPKENRSLDENPHQSRQLIQYENRENRVSKLGRNYSHKKHVSMYLH